MSQKFISLDDAATRLGLSKDRLNQMREAGDLRAYRDGASWKFRTEEIEKLESDGVPADDDSLELGDLSMGDDSGAADDDDIGLGVEPLGDGDDAESILLTDDDEGLPRPQSTIIGKSELSLEDDLALAPGSDAPQAASEGGSFDGLEELELDLEAESSKVAGKSATSDLELLEEESAVGGDDAGGSGSVAGLSGLDSIDLAADDEDDLVLGGVEDSDPAVGDSGVNLAPSDSGFSLDEVPLDLGGSAVGSQLDLASLSSGGSALSDLSVGGSDAGAEDFQLTPDDSADEDESSSQVVALDEFSEEEEEDGPGFEAVDDDDGAFGDGGFGDGAAAGLSTDGAAAPVAVAAQDATFPGWIIGVLGASLVTCLMAGFLAMELLRSMWSFAQPLTFSGGMIESLADLISG